MARMDGKDFLSVKVPTLKQAIAKGLVTEKEYVVNTIWFPNQFPILTLETDTFRFNVDKEKPLYETLVEEIQLCQESELTLFVAIYSLKPLTMETLSKPGEKCEWRTLGETGLRAENFKKVTAKRESKKPVA